MGSLAANIVLIWFLLIAFFLIYYVVADGFDLGVGIISLASRDEGERGIMMASLRSFWHDNQTWLVVMAGMLFGAFPVFYGLVLSSLYIPIFVMLFGLIFRGVSFEFRSHSERKRLWGFCFGAGSLIATLGQGFAIGSVFYGLPVRDGRFAGSVFDWFNPFSGLTAAGLLFGYVTLGASFLIIKTRDGIQEKSYAIAAFSALLMLIAGAWTVLRLYLRHAYMARKLAVSPDRLIMEAFAALVVIAVICLFLSLAKKKANAPFVWSAAIIVLAFAGVSYALYPYMIPGAVTVHDAAASSPETLVFMLAVTAVLIPVILGYTGYKYWVFRGKTEKGSDTDEPY